MPAILAPPLLYAVTRRPPFDPQALGIGPVEFLREAVHAPLVLGGRIFQSGDLSHLVPKLMPALDNNVKIHEKLHKGKTKAAPDKWARR